MQGQRKDAAYAVKENTCIQAVAQIEFFQSLTRLLALTGPKKVFPRSQPPLVKSVGRSDPLVLSKRLHWHCTGIESGIALAKRLTAAAPTQVQAIVVDTVATAEGVLVVSEPSEVETGEKLSPVLFQTEILTFVRRDGDGSTGAP